MGEVMRGGRLFRYCATSAETSQVAQAEKEFAAMVNQKYALGVNSCSSAIMLALMAVGVEPGDQVITNGFTFTALPSTIMRLGAEPVLVEATKSWIMDLDDLEKKIAAFLTRRSCSCRTCAARSRTWTGWWRSARRTASR